MAHLSCWHMTDLPTDIVEIVERDLQKYDEHAHDSQLTGEEVDKVIRNSKNLWIPTANWIGGWLWYYIEKSNRENFCYDIVDIDNCHIQYTQYGPGQFIIGMEMQILTLSINQRCFLPLVIICHKIRSLYVVNI